MLKITPKNARTRRILQKREPKIEENVKTAIFIRGNKTNQIVNEALTDLCSLKKPYSIKFSKKNNIRPFEDETSLEFFCQKNDASLFVIGSHSKKKPNNLVFVRMFDGQVLDMIEVGIEKSIPIKDFKTRKCSIDVKPLFIFNGELFESSQIHKTFKNMLLDVYRGKTVKSIDLKGLEHVISVTAVSNNKIYFRVYIVQMTKSDQKTPRIELEEMGPSYNFVLKRTKFAKEEVYKQATKVPRTLKPKKEKNVNVNEMGDVVGRIHVGKQDLSKLQTRKIKGLKRGTDDDFEKTTQDKKQKI
ncbi:5842_t:CDS:2 [Diversispora eburnea]|uniref:Ribosome production factor 2 homolog n=1 Tax=Diversispora eburnea TaxID=1213867 RepID=A0A9N9FLD4_9GLOM|nr:5842_t:CDS:2 [Diversispora eburnea]